MESPVLRQVDEMLDQLLALRQSLQEAGHAALASSNDLAADVRGYLAGKGGKLPSVVAYEDIVPGLRIGFQQGRPLHLQAVARPGGFELSLVRQTNSQWLTLEMSWSGAALAHKGQARLLATMSGNAEFTLPTFLRIAQPERPVVEVPGSGLPVSPRRATVVDRFVPPDAEGLAPDAQVTVVAFLPTTPFALLCEKLLIL